MSVAVDPKVVHLDTSKMELAAEAQKAEQFLKETIVVSINNETYEFRIPSVRDRMKIDSYAAKLRRDNDPDGAGLVYGYTPVSLMYFDNIASFMILLKSTSAKWVYTPDDVGKPIMNIDKWAEDAPVMEVMEQFSKELIKFRERGN